MFKASSGQKFLGEKDFMSHLGKHSGTEYFFFSEMSASLKMQISKPFKEKWTQVFNSLNLCLNSAITAKPQDGSSSMHLPLQLLTSHHLFKLLVFTPKGKSDTKRFAQEWHHKDSFQVQAETKGKTKTPTTFKATFKVCTPSWSMLFCFSFRGSSFLRSSHIQPS